MKPRFERFIFVAILLLILLLLTGCRQAAVQEVKPSLMPTPDATFLVTASTSPASDPLDSTSWVLLSLYGKPPLEGSHVTLEFSNGFIRGSAGCNGYESLVIGDDEAGGKYNASEDGSLKIPSILVTLLDCRTPAGVMDQEDTYLKALRSAVAYRLVENHLELQDAEGMTTLVFTH